MGITSLATVIIPCGPGAETALDTAASVAHYCPEPHEIVFVDDCTSDGTHDALKNNLQPNWHLLRNEQRNGRLRLVQSLCSGYLYTLKNLAGECILRLDQDALVIGPNVLSDALKFMRAHPQTGIFGVYTVDYNRPRSYTAHAKLMRRELAFWRMLIGRGPSWRGIYARALKQGYRTGDNVFGGAYFVTRSCLQGMQRIGALDVPHDWHSKLMEDVYFSMAAVAAEFEMSHFAAPNGPMCLEWEGLPYPARELCEKGYKVTHSVDKGKNTGRGDNDGKTAREVFRELRAADARS